MFCTASQEDAIQIVEYRQKRAIDAMTAAQHEMSTKEREDLRKRAVEVLTEEKGALNFDRISVQEKMEQLRKEKDKDNKPTIHILLKTDVAGSVEGMNDKPSTPTHPRMSLLTL